MPRKTRTRGLTSDEKRIRAMVLAYIARHRQLQEQRNQLLAERQVLKALKLNPLDGEKGPSKVDQDAPLWLQFCQELEYFLYLVSTEMTYEQYCANHEACG